MPRVLLAAVCTALALTGCAVSVPSPDGEPQGARAPGRLADVEVAREVNDGSYEREAFGSPWKDVDRNGCDTRNDILARDLRDIETREDCAVLSGVLADDPYGDGSIDFTRSKPTAVQIDHIYPLALAWRMGASEWDGDRRAEFANDPDNLLAVGGRANQRKGDSGPEEWQPPADFACAYAGKFIDVAIAYDLPVTRAAHDALGTMLEDC